MDAAFAREAREDLLGDQGKQRARGPEQYVHDRVERVVGVDLVRTLLLTPEAGSAAADVPVVERVDEARDPLASSGDVVRVEVLADTVQQISRLCHDVAIQHLLGVGAERRSKIFRVRV